MTDVAISFWGPPSQRFENAIRWGTHGARVVDLENGTWYDHEANEGGGVFDLVEREKGLKGLDRLEWLRREGFEIPRPNGGANSYSPREVVARYDYTDEFGKLSFQVVRFQPKTFRQRRPAREDDPANLVRDGWVWSVKGVNAVPYRLPEVIEAISLEQAVFIVEGEKDVDRLWSIGVPATCNPMGAGKWTSWLNKYFRGATVVIVPDNDDPGRAHARQVADALSGIATSLKVLELPGLRSKCDLSDWLDAGGTAEELYDMCSVCPAWEPDAAAKDPRTVLSSAQFVAGFIAPDYLIDGIIQRRFFYSMTAPTGAGKTALALRLAAHVEGGRDLGDHAVEKGRVLYLAGENPDDVRMRWLAMGERMGFDVATVNVHFIPGTFSIPELEPRIRQEVEAIGGMDLIIVDTSAAYFEGDQENDNVAMGDHARMLRNLVNLPGGPCVLALCHPVKNAANDNLIPRGGGAFIAEVDGNLVCIKNDTTVELDWQGKLRGPGFDPIAFELLSVQCDAVKDSKGRMLPTVIARPLSDREHAAKVTATRTDQDTIMVAMLNNDGASIATLAEKAEWTTSTGRPHKSKVHRVLTQLKKDHIVANKRGTWTLTDSGKKEAKKAKDNAALAGARYS